MRHLHECGFVLNPKFDYLGASPDGRICDDGIHEVLEIKCPYTARDSTIKEGIVLVKEFALEESEGGIALKQ